MPKLPAKFEDWTPPWADGEFDEDKAARLVFNALSGQEKAKARATAAEADLEKVTEERDGFKAKVESQGSSETDLQKALTAEQARTRDLQKKLDDVKDYDSLVSERDRLDVALELGLTKSQAKRLVGKDRDELAADAEELAKDLGITTGAGEDRGHRGLEGLDGRISAGRQRVIRSSDLGNGNRDRGEKATIGDAESLAKNDDLWG